jgi:hypothetical protein
MTSKPRGSEYLKARLAKDHPEILARFNAGEFPGLRSAALAAGIITPTITVPDDPELAARRLLLHFEGERRAAFIRIVAEAGGG